MTRSGFAKVLAALYLICGAAALILMPHFTQVYDDLYGTGGMPLPRLTQVLLRAPPMAWFTCAVVMAAVLLEVDRKGAARWVHVAFTVILIVTVLTAAVYIFIPLAGTIIGKVN